MNLQRIESASGLDPKSITFSNLGYQNQTGVYNTTGAGLLKTSGYRSGVVTELGDIEISVWRELIKQLITESGEQWLQDALFQWEKEHNYRHDTLTELREKALKHHSMRIFDRPAWVDFIPFNERYRPSVLENANIVMVVTECCGLPAGRVTQEQIDAAIAGRICCPHCGRHSPFEKVKSGAPAPEAKS